MRKRVLCVVLLLALSIPTVAALADGEAIKLAIHVSDIVYTDAAGKTLDLKGLEGALALCYLLSEDGPQAKLDIGVTTPDARAFDMLCALDESYALFSLDGKTAYGSSRAAADPALRELLAAIEGLIGSANSVQTGESTADIPGALRDSYSYFKDECDWAEQGESEIEFFGEPRRAMKHTAAITMAQYDDILRKEMRAWGMADGLIELIVAAEESADTTVECAWYEIGEREAVYETCFAEEIRGDKTYHRTRAHVRTLGGGFVESKETSETWSERAPDKVKTSTVTMFARRDADASGAGQLALTLVDHDYDGIEIDGLELRLTPVRAKHGWAYELSLIFDYQDIYTFVDDLLISDYDDAYDYEGLIDSPFGGVETYESSGSFTLRGTIAGEDGDSAFTGALAVETKTGEDVDHFEANITANFSPYLNGPIEVPIMESLIDVNNMGDAHSAQLAYELIDAVSRAYVVIQEMPAVKAYQNKTSRVTDLAG